MSLSEFNRFFKKQSLAATYKPTLLKCLLDLGDYNQDSNLWYFEMDDWLAKAIKFEKRNNKFYVKRNDMKKITLNNYREIMEKHWKEFEN